MTFLRRLVVVLAVAIIGWWGAAQVDLLPPQYHPVVVAERLLYGSALTPLGEPEAEGMSEPSGPVSRPAPQATAAPAVAAVERREAVAVTPAAVESLPLPAIPTVAVVPDVAPTLLPEATTEPGTAPVPITPQTAATTPSVTLTPTPLPLPDAATLAAAREYMLELINLERAKVGAPPVVLGDNVAAQLHAESALENCFSSHWGADGLKPYMRYTLAGGYQSNGENVSGLNYCIKAGDGYRPLDSPEQEMREAMDGLMRSPGHRRQILKPRHRKVNIGLAWDKYNFRVAQQFEGDYVEYSRLPTIDNGVISFAGQTRNGLEFGDRKDLRVQVYYDPPPYPLTRGQLARTSCVGIGIQVAILRSPLPSNRSYTEHQFSKGQSQCPDPYAVPADTPGPGSHDAAHRVDREADSISLPKLQVSGPRITASSWRANGRDFAVTANFREVIDQHGPGVYTVEVWGNAGEEYVVISRYAIFYGVEPPGGYGG